MNMTDKEIAKLSADLKAYYMGELVPPHEAIRGYYDDGGDPRYYQRTRACVECLVEYIHNDPEKSYFSENTLAAHITLYVGNGQFFKATEYWDAESVRQFRSEIVINMCA